MILTLLLSYLVFGVYGGLSNGGGNTCETCNQFPSSTRCYNPYSTTDNVTIWNAFGAAEQGCELTLLKNCAAVDWVWKPNEACPSCKCTFNAARSNGMWSQLTATGNTCYYSICEQSSCDPQNRYYQNVYPTYTYSEFESSAYTCATGSNANKFCYGANDQIEGKMGDMRIMDHTTECRLQKCTGGASSTRWNSTQYDSGNFAANKVAFKTAFLDFCSKQSLSTAASRNVKAVELCPDADLFYGVSTTNTCPSNSNYCRDYLRCLCSNTTATYQNDNSNQYYYKTKNMQNYRCTCDISVTNPWYSECVTTTLAYPYLAPNSRYCRGNGGSLSSSCSVDKYASFGSASSNTMCGIISNTVQTDLLNPYPTFVKEPRSSFPTQSSIPTTQQTFDYGCMMESTCKALKANGMCIKTDILKDVTLYRREGAPNDCPMPPTASMSSCSSSSSLTRCYDKKTYKEMELGIAMQCFAAEKNLMMARTCNVSSQLTNAFRNMITCLHGSESLVKLMDRLACSSYSNYRNTEKICNDAEQTKKAAMINTCVCNFVSELHPGVNWNTAYDVRQYYMSLIQSIAGLDIATYQSRGCRYNYMCSGHGTGSVQVTENMYKTDLKLSAPCEQINFNTDRSGNNWIPEEIPLLTRVSSAFPASLSHVNGYPKIVKVWNDATTGNCVAEMMFKFQGMTPYMADTVFGNWTSNNLGTVYNKTVQQTASISSSARRINIHFAVFSAFAFAFVGFFFM